MATSLDLMDRAERHPVAGGIAAGAAVAVLLGGLRLLFGTRPLVPLLIGTIGIFVTVATGSAFMLRLRRQTGRSADTDELRQDEALVADRRAFLVATPFLLAASTVGSIAENVSTTVGGVVLGTCLLAVGAALTWRARQHRGQSEPGTE